MADITGGILDRIFPRRERRAKNSIESPKVRLSSASILEYFGLTAGKSGVIVTEQSAIGLPPVWCAVNFLSRAMAALPLHVYTQKGEEKTRAGGPLEALLGAAANDDLTSYAWRHWFWTRVLTNGRGLTYIERDDRGNPINLFPLEPSKTTKKRQKGRVGGDVFYEYDAGGGKRETYEARDVIDVAFMLKEDGLNHYGPIATCRERIAQAMNANGYGAKVFDKGGLPQLAVEVPTTSQEALKRAGDDIAQASIDAYNEGKPVIALPVGHTLKPIGVEPDKMQLVQFQHFIVEEVARIYQIPPVFLQHLLNNSYSNAEQQDLTLVKHVILGWARALETELDLKLFGRENAWKRRRYYTAHNVDGLLRGDFEKRMEGLAKGVQNAILTPNEARALENRPPMEKGGELLIQGATVPLGSQPKTQPAPNPPAE